MLSARERESEFAEIRASGAQYVAPATPSPPVIPFQVFGVAYDLDLVIVCDHPRWTMHELARVPSAAGPIWIAKESEANGVQTVIAGGEGVFALAPEIPVPRIERELEISDRCTDTRLDFLIRYRGTDGDEVEIAFEGPYPAANPFFRNGNTMGHSRQIVAAVIDIARQSRASRASIRIGGRPYAIRRILGIVPFAYALEQVQGGFSISDFRQTSTREGFHLLRGEKGEPWILKLGPGKSATATRESPLGTIGYVFRRESTGADQAWELAGAFATQQGRGTRCFELRIQPALPDLRRPFQGKHTSRFVIDINGRPGYAVGTIEAESGLSNAEGAFVRILPSQPAWIASRPMESRIAFPGDGSATVVSRLTSISS